MATNNPSNPLVEALINNGGVYFNDDRVDQGFIHDLLYKSNPETFEKANEAYKSGLDQLVKAEAKDDFARLVEERFKLITENLLEPLQAKALLTTLAAQCNTVEPAKGNWKIVSICNGYKRKIPVMQDGTLICAMQDFLEDPSKSICNNVHSVSNLSYDGLLAGIIHLMHV